MPSNADHVWVVNEDLGLNANLVTGVNDTFETTLPYPSEWDPDSEVMMVYEVDHTIQSQDRSKDDAFLNWLGIQYSMVDRSADALYRGDLTDIRDEWMKSLFTSPMHFGTSEGHLTGVAATEVTRLLLDVNRHAVFHPKLRLPTFFPIFLEIWNQASLFATATGVDTNTDFAAFEAVALHYWYTIRQMTSRERAMIQGLPGIQQRWAQLGS